MANHHITAAFLERNQPDLYVGHDSALWLQKLSCAKLDVVKPEKALGFEAIIGGARRVREALAFKEGCKG